MLRTLFSLALVAALATPLMAAEKLGAAKGPLGPPPRIMVVSVAQDGHAYIRVRTTRAVPQVRKVQVQINGQVQEQQVTVYVQVTQEMDTSLTGKDVQVFGIDGKQIDPKDLPKLLKKSSPVLVSANGKKVDPFYLRLARKGTLVVVSPKLVEAALPFRVMPPMPIKEKLLAPRDKT